MSGAVIFFKPGRMPAPLLGLEGCVIFDKTRLSCHDVTCFLCRILYSEKEYFYAYVITEQVELPSLITRL